MPMPSSELAILPPRLRLRVAEKVEIPQRGERQHAADDDHDVDRAPEHGS